jgi:hypothetical protein
VCSTYDIFTASVPVLTTAEFHYHAAALLGLLLRTTKQDRTRDRSFTQLALASLHRMARREASENVVIPDQQLRLVLPDLLRVAELKPAAAHLARLRALAVLRDLLDRIPAMGLNDLAAPLVLSLLRILQASCRPSSGSNGSASGGFSSGGSGNNNGLLPPPLPPMPSHVTSANLSSPNSGNSGGGMNNASNNSSSSSPFTFGSTSTTSGNHFSDVPTEQEGVELRSAALRTLAKVAKRLGAHYQPYLAAARIQLMPLRRYLEKQALTKGGVAAAAAAAAAAASQASNKNDLSGVDGDDVLFDSSQHVTDRAALELYDFVASAVRFH